jgi:serine/threonine-protein kinase
MVHGDVRPENVFVTYDGQVKVMNFGAARLDERANMSNGRLAYAAPEQVRGRPSDRRTDVFAIGVMLWEVLAGKPFTADPTNSAALKARLFGLEPRISQAVPGLPHGLINICNRAISVDPSDRFSTAEDFRDALLAFLRASGEAIDARKTGVQIRALFGPERAAMHRIIDSALNLEVEPAASIRSPSEREPAASARSPSEREPAASARSPSEMETPRQGKAPAVTSVPPLSRALEPDEIDDIEDAPRFRSRRPAMVAALGATLLAAAGGFWFGMSRFVNEQSGAAASAPPGVAGVASVIVPRPAATAAAQPEPVRAEAEAPQPEPVRAEAEAPQPEPVRAEAEAPQPEQARAKAEAPQPEQARAKAEAPRAEQAAAPTASETPEPLAAPSASVQGPRSRPRTQKADEPQTPGVSPDNPYEE